MKFVAEIKYTMLETHPDIGCVEDWTPEKEFAFDDTYTFDPALYSRSDIDGILSHIRNDLRLIAGGGYNSNHIDNVRFTIKEVRA